MEYSLPLNSCDRGQILGYFEESWRKEEELFKSIKEEEIFYTNPDCLRNPLIFYLGHSAVFYINKMKMAGMIKDSLDEEYESIYAVGVDPENEEELREKIGKIRWHGVKEVWDYRKRAYEKIKEAIENTPLDLPITEGKKWWSVVMGIEHQRIHIETSSMLIRQVEEKWLEKPSGWGYALCGGINPPQEMVFVEGGRVRIGKQRGDNYYGWDVDFGRREVEVGGFWVSKYLVTNGEFLKFVEEGGYENPDYWCQRGWRWREENGVKHPKFWRRGERGDYKYRLMFEEVELPLAFPVEVNLYEAMAYCRYLGRKDGCNYRLMREAEWHVASRKEGEREGDYNLNFRYHSPTPVGGMEGARSDSGVYDCRGNVWEWLGETLKPLEGFATHYLYEDYSAPFFDDNHYLLIGGSWASSGHSASRYYRNWFRPCFYQHAGFRLVLGE